MRSMYAQSHKKVPKERELAWRKDRSRIRAMFPYTMRKGLKIETHKTEDLCIEVSFTWLYKFNKALGRMFNAGPNYEIESWLDFGAYRTYYLRKIGFNHGRTVITKVVWDFGS